MHKKIKGQSVKMPIFVNVAVGLLTKYEYFDILISSIDALFMNPPARGGAKFCKKEPFLWGLVFLF